MIIFASDDETQYKRVSQIAPTVTFNSFASLEQRLHTLGSIFGKKQEAERWLNNYHAKAASMWNQLRSHIRPGETASVFIYEHGERLFVMGTTGLSSAIYHPFGFQPVDRIQEVLCTGSGFQEISEDSLPAYAGDRIFMLRPANEVSRNSMERMMNSALWKSIPAVQKGRVYLIEAEKWNYGVR